MQQALFKCETPRLKLKSSRSFLAIKRWQRTKSKKVIKHLRSSKLRWAHICAHSRIPVKGFAKHGLYKVPGENVRSLYDAAWNIAKRLHEVNDLPSDAVPQSY
jgi:hypothetical protein